MVTMPKCPRIILVVIAEDLHVTQARVHLIQQGDWPVKFSVAIRESQKFLGIALTNQLIAQALSKSEFSKSKMSLGGLDVHSINSPSHFINACLGQ